MKRLTNEQIEDRMTMYEDAASHLEQEVCHTDSEREQATIVARQIRSLAEAFWKARNKQSPAHQKSVPERNQLGQ